MTTRQIKVYPSERNFQRSDDTTVPLTWAIEYLRTVSNSIPDIERAGARVEGWGGVSVWYDHVLSKDEVFRERIERARVALSKGASDGLNADAVREIFKLLAQD